MTVTTRKPRRNRADAKSALPTAATPPSQSLRDILAPLATVALQTSVNAYAWGLREKSLIRASVVMDLCSEVIQRSNQLLGHTTPVAAPPAQTRATG